MAIGSHERSQGRVCSHKIKEKMDKELREIRAQMENLAFKMQ
jgi:hypothetical protein